MRKHKPHWYKTYISECPLCGGGHTERTRVYGTKPEDFNERYDYAQIYDYCDAL